MLILNRRIRQLRPFKTTDYRLPFPCTPTNNNQTQQLQSTNSFALSHSNFLTSCIGRINLLQRPNLHQLLCCLLYIFDSNTNVMVLTSNHLQHILTMYPMLTLFTNIICLYHHCYAFMSICEDYPSHICFSWKSKIRICFSTVQHL